jgi:RNA-directed DNA polymerase
MDDMVWWAADRAAVRRTLEAARTYLADRLRLDIKIPVNIGRSSIGLVFCGYRILPDRLLLSRRRKRRYIAIRRQWESACADHGIDSLAL